VLAAIAAISLVVGGVGVMNIMLVAVSERMQEIGIRMAVGARPRDVQLQFLIESIVLCLVGGLLGALIPTLLAVLANQFQDKVPLTPDWLAFTLAIAVATTIGIAFGFIPARRASRLSPVTALARE
jgi:macrolide transport system ATP-binding/permease protein